MPPILSLARATDRLWASGPEGLYYLKDDEDEAPTTVPQPHEHLYCSAACGDYVFVGGLPYSIVLTTDSGANWQAVSFDGVEQAVMCIAPDPQFEESAVVLAGTDGEGILRTSDHGWHWTVCNFGLENYTVLSLAWAAPRVVWPYWAVVFAGTEDGLYRSPNGGLGWSRCVRTEGVFQTVAVSEAFHEDGLVLAGTDGNGLWRSSDWGRRFDHVDSAPEQINAIAATPAGWLLSTDVCLYASRDSINWRALPDTSPALTLLTAGDSVWIGTLEGLGKYRVSTFFIAL